MHCLPCKEENTWPVAVTVLTFTPGATVSVKTSSVNQHVVRHLSEDPDPEPFFLLHDLQCPRSRTFSAINEHLWLPKSPGLTMYNI